MNIEEAAKAAGFVSSTYGLNSTPGMYAFNMEIVERFAKIIRNQALEDAVKICDSVNNYSNPTTANDCADAIRAMKEQI